MMMLSLSEAESISKIEIYRESIHKYCVRVRGFHPDRSAANEVIYTWSNNEEATICARGICKMFNKSFELIISRTT
jgi:hypothetical protein